MERVVYLKTIPILVNKLFQLLVGIGQPEESPINLRVKVIVKVRCIVNS